MFQQMGMGVVFLSVVFSCIHQLHHHFEEVRMERDSPGTFFAALAFCWLPRVSLQRTWWQAGIGALHNLLAGKCRIQPCTREFWSKCARLGGRDSSTTPRITFGPFTHHGYQCCEPLCSNSVMPVSNMVMATRSNWVLQTFARFFEKFDLFVDILALYPDSTHHVRT